MSTFEAATAVTPVGDGTWSVDLAPEFAILGTKPNGGYMLACMARAAVSAAADAGATQRHVISAGAQYLASPDVGPATIEVDVLRVGRTATQVRARLCQGDTVGVQATFVLGSLQPGSVPYLGGDTAPPMPPFDECDVPVPSAGDRGVEVRFDPAAGFTVTPDGPRGTGGGEYRVWFSVPDGPLDSAALLYAADVLPPATFGLFFTGWVPTLDLTVYIRAVPAPGPLRLRFRVQVVHDGFADEVLEAWDADGRLVLQSTQLVALRMPEG